MRKLNENDNGLEAKFGSQQDKKSIILLAMSFHLNMEKKGFSLMLWNTEIVGTHGNHLCARGKNCQNLKLY